MPASRTILLALTLVSLVFVPRAESQSPSGATPVPTPLASRLSPLGWLAGCWEQRTPRRVTLEMWMPPEANLMLGASRTTAGGKVREFE